MASTLPYIASPGNIDKTLRAIKAAATPASVSQDFVKTILKIPGSSGDQIAAFLKKIGFAESDGTPTQRYHRFRNSATSGLAVAEAIREAYAPLFTRNEYAHSLSDDELRGLIIEETGVADDSRVPALILAAFTALKQFADFSAEAAPAGPESEPESVDLPPMHLDGPHVPSTGQTVGMNLSYQINLNLPATTDISVFNAIFKSLKENLLKNIQ